MTDRPTTDELMFALYIEALVAAGSEPDVDDVDYDSEAAYEAHKERKLAG